MPASFDHGLARGATPRRAHELPELLLKPWPPDEETQEKLDALRAIIPRAASGDFPRCLLCDSPTEFPALIGYTRGALKNPAGMVLVICLPCLDSSEDIRAALIEDFGEEEIKTSTWAS
jgi:hypothetical protein